MIDAATFRQQFPEFQNATLFPDEQIAFWASLAIKLISKSRWGDLYEHGQALFIAHNLMLGVYAQAEAAAGGVPQAQPTGTVTSKKVGDVQVNYDAGSNTMEPNAGHWNKTAYGQRYINLVRLIGQGCYQL